MDNHLGETAQGRLDLYITARKLFDEFYSHPQIVEILSECENDKKLLTDIVDNAMIEGWDKLYRKAIKLFGLGWIKADVINELSKTEPDAGVIEILVDDLFDRWFEVSEENNERKRKARMIVKIIQFSTIAIAIVFLVIGKKDTFLIYGIGFTLLLFTGFFFKKIYTIRRLKTFKKLLDFEITKRRIIVTRLKKLFLRKNDMVLNIYCTAGFPELNSTLTIINSLAKFGADLIELGMPYSDPLADGPVIQASGSKALANGMTIKVLFEQLKNLRKSPSFGGVGEVVPVILMGYMNPVLQYGFEKFCEDAAAVGIDGLILPDLPEHEFENEYGAIIKKYGLDFIFLVTPETSDERIKKLDELSSGFLYAVSSSSTTGNEKDFNAVEKYLQRLQNLNLRNPVLAGFGIKDKQTFQSACKYANGAIIGSAYIKALENTTDILTTTKDFLNGIKG